MLPAQPSPFHGHLGGRTEGGVKHQRMRAAPGGRPDQLVARHWQGVPGSRREGAPALGTGHSLGLALMRQVQRQARQLRMPQFQSRAQAHGVQDLQPAIGATPPAPPVGAQ